MLRRKRRRRSGSTAPARNRRRRLFAQALEDRRVLAAFTVVTTGDAGGGTCSAVECTLRDAVAASNAAVGADTISFDPSVTGTITTLSGSGGEIEVTDSVTITGPGAAAITIDANASVGDPFRVFNVNSADADVVIEGLTISGGHMDPAEGGAIRFGSDGTLTIRNSIITGNQANNGGAIYSEYAGTIEIEDSEISNNTASYGMGGAIHNVSGNVVITGGSVTDNSAYGNGGAISSPYQGSVTLTSVDLSRNQVTNDGYSGGGLYSGEGDITITGSTITGNTSAGDGGALYSINGEMRIDNTTLRGNQSNYNGGAIFNESGNVSITGSTIDQNSSLLGDGGGISTIAGVTTITRSTISGNASVTSGGGISNVRGQMILRESTVSGNTSGSNGGGIATNTGDVTITNSTISGNGANVRGGGIQTDSAMLRVVNSTIVSNTATVSGGGIGTLIGFLTDDPDSEIFLHNTILAQNTSPDSPDLSIPRDPVANLEILNSLIGNNADTGLTASATADANGNLIGTAAALIDPGLGTLAANGGSVLTHEPTSSSVVIGAGDDALAIDYGVDGAPGGGDDVALTTDGRSGLYTRIASTGGAATTVDMGAVEIQSTPLLIVDTLIDENDGNFTAGNRSLREVLLLANAEPGDDSILFAGGLEGTITLDEALGSLTITETVSIVGPGADKLTIQGADGTSNRLIDITASATNVTLGLLTLSGGNAGSGEGGAVRSAATGELILRLTEITGSNAALGGAVAVSDGQLSIAGSTIAGNTATSHGGGVHLSGSTALLQLVNTTFDTNSSGGSGGAVYADVGSVSVASSTIAGNSAVMQTGGVWVSGATAQTVVVVNSIVATNTAASAPDLVDSGSTTLSVTSSFIGDNDGTTLEASPVNSGLADKNSSGSYVGTHADSLDPLLGALVNNGGTVRTLAPSAASLSLDTGSGADLPLDPFDLDNDNARNELLPVDARGAQRVSLLLDIGAVELPPAPTLVWNSPTSIVYATALDDTQLNATSSVPGTFAYTPPAGTVLDAGADQILTAVFTPDNQLVSRSATVSVTISVLQADPVLTWSDPTSIVFGTELDDTQLNATSNAPGTFVYTPSTAAVLDAGTQTLSVTFTPTDSVNFNEVTATVSIIVDQATPTVVWNEPAGIAQGTALGDDQLNATADVAGAFSYTPAAGTVLNAGDDQALTVVFTPTDPNYAEASASTLIDVTSAVEFDFGDAPSNYPVTLADDGARHEMGTLRLGALVDSEADGNPSADAEGDGADDDGVTILTSLVVPSAGQSVTVGMSVTVSEDAFLDAWLDFNGNGSWGDSGEQIASSLAVTAGANHLTFNVPSDAVVGLQFARFRISSTGGLSPTGAASDGEVEDYSVDLVAGNGASEVLVDHDREQILVDVQNDVVRIGTVGNGDTFYSGNVGEANRIVVNADNQDNVFLISPTASLPALQLNGAEGVDQITLDQGDLDFTTGVIQASGIEAIRMTGSGVQSIVLDNDVVSAVTSTGTLVVGGAAGHTLTIADASEWSMGSPTTVDGQFTLPITHNASGNVILASLAAQWQNVISPSDVNANGVVTAGDALVIVNELARRAYSDESNGQLDDASTADPFPGFFYDQDGNGNVTALDALRVINELARSSNSGGGEQSPGQTATGQAATGQSSNVEGEWASLVDALIRSATQEERQELASESGEFYRLLSINASSPEAVRVAQQPEGAEDASDSIAAEAIDELMNELAATGV